MTTYVRFIEHNDWEGESWNFYLQVEGNENALLRLEEMLPADNEDYELDLTVPYTKKLVKTLVKHSRTGYMRYHNRVDGVLDIDLLDSIDWEDGPAPFYKGGIKDFFLKGSK